MSPWTVARQAPCPWDFPGKNTRVGCYFLLQGIFQTQDPNRVSRTCLLHAGRFFTTEPPGSPHRQSTGRQLGEKRRIRPINPRPSVWDPEPESRKPSFSGLCYKLCNKTETESENKFLFLILSKWHKYLSLTSHSQRSRFEKAWKEIIFYSCKLISACWDFYI